METKQQIINKIATLEQWLMNNSAEPVAQPQIMADLQGAKQQLIDYQKQEEIIKRLEILHEALVEDSLCEKAKKIFTEFERIQINQERAGLFEQLDYENGSRKDYRNTKVSEFINNKINRYGNQRN